MATYRTLFQFREGTNHDRGRISMNFLEGKLNETPIEQIGEVAEKVESEVSYVNNGGGCTRGIADNHVRPEPRATTVLLIYVSDAEDVNEAEVARQTAELQAVDAIAVERSGDNRWKPRWVASSAV